MGVGDPLEAAIELQAPLPAGPWHLVADGIIIQPVDVRFDILWRRAGGGDTTLATFMHHFDPRPPGMFDAVPFEDTALGPAADAHKGDQLVLRYGAMGATVEMAYIPNGDGAMLNGRIPFIELPPP